MKFPLTYTLVLLVLSIGLVMSYPYFLKDKAEMLWGPIKGNLRKFYYFSIGLVFVGFLPFAYFLLTCDKWNEKEIQGIFYAMMLLIVASWFWIVFSIQFAEEKSNKSCISPKAIGASDKVAWLLQLLRVIIVLLLLTVSLSILNLMLIVKNHSSVHFKEMKDVVMFGLGYGFFHTFFLDFILWAKWVLF